MNIELLKKLTRLANNNPNENEANLAARKVCKMLEDGKFALNSYSVPETPKFTQPTYTKDMAEEFMKQWHTQNKQYYRSHDYDSPYEQKRKQYNKYDIPKPKPKWDKDKAPTVRCKKCGKDFKAPYATTVCAKCSWEVY
jgi:hypothetical protein